MNGDIITTEKLHIERKHFFLDLKENSRGRFLRITEDVKGRRDAIIIPATGLHEMLDALEAIVDINDDNPFDESKYYMDDE